jgi:hypothetical protein
MVGMSFQLIYVDDYGNTGLKLDDPAQPLFMLFGLVVPDDRWHAVETELWTINKTVAQTIGVELFNFELHAWQFFSNRNKTFRALSLDEQAEIVRRIATVLRDHSGRYVAVYVKKADLREGLEGTSRAINALLDHPEARHLLPALQLGVDPVAYRAYMGKLLPHLFSPYVVSLATLIVEIDELLSSQNRRGVLILDRQTSTKPPTPSKRSPSCASSRTRAGCAACSSNRCRVTGDPTSSCKQQT